MKNRAGAVTTGWGSENAEAMFHVAVRLAGFNAIELMSEIVKLQRDASKNTNRATVIHAMQNICDRHKQD